MTAGRIEALESWVAGTLHVVRVADDAGRIGIGQSACWAYPEAVDAVVGSLRPHLLGADAGDIERVWHLAYRTGPFRGSILSAAVSALDIALWDLRGRALGVPVHQLLGGRYRRRLRLHLLILGWKDHGDLRTRVADAVADGYTAVKLDPLPTGYQDLSLPALCDAVASSVAVARDAAGEDVDVIVELHRALTPLQARPAIECLGESRPLFVEDPLQIDSLVQQADLARAVSVPLGQGERLHNAWEVRDLLELGGPQYVRTDVGLAGGITQARKIAAVAEALGSWVCWHTYSGPVVSAAAAHLGLALPNVVTQEWYPPLDEPGAVAGLTTAMRRDGGWLTVGDEPGLGVELAPERLAPVTGVGRPLGRWTFRADGSNADVV